MTIRRPFALVCCVALWASLGPAKEKPQPITLTWPPAATPTLSLTFGQFVQLAAYNGQLSLQSPVLIQNLSGKLIPQASFTVYLLDKSKVRIGSGNLNISDLEPGQQVKLPFQVFSLGVPSSLALVARSNAAGVPTSLKTFPLKVISVPPGASLKVDGRTAGTTPAVVDLMIGTHTLEFSKEGFSPGSTPVDIKPDETPGGSITFELGGLSADSVELRNGTVLQCDVISMNMTSVVIRVDGKDQALDRNQINKIFLVQRESSQAGPATQPQK
jgi:hypothetical protein